MSARPHAVVTLAIGAVALIIGVSGAWASPPAHADAGRPAAANCVGEEGPDAEEAQDDGGEKEGEDEGAPPTFSPAFYRRTVTLDVSLDGLDGRDLPMAIEQVCDIPRRLAKEAAQLVGGDGVARVRPTTRVVQDGKRLYGNAAATALRGADTAVLNVRLLRPRSWRQDEEGDRVATFSARRIDITD
jgi:hypothetical protein